MRAMKNIKHSTLLVLAVGLAMQGIVEAAGDISAHHAYLDCVDTAINQGLSTDVCCFPLSSTPGRFASLSPDSEHCRPPFAFCHKHTVGYSFDKPSNFQVPADPSIAFYRCGDYGEPCSEVCTNDAYSPVMVNSGQVRAGKACTAFEFDHDIMAEYAFPPRRWDYSSKPGAP